MCLLQGVYKSVIKGLKNFFFVDKISRVETWVYLGAHVMFCKFIKFKVTCNANIFVFIKLLLRQSKEWMFISILNFHWMQIYQIFNLFGFLRTTGFYRNFNNIWKLSGMLMSTNSEYSRSNLTTSMCLSRH